LAKSLPGRKLSSSLKFSPTIFAILPTKSDEKYSDTPISFITNNRIILFYLFNHLINIDLIDLKKCTIIKDNCIEKI